MEEKVKFVWEKDISVYLQNAKKQRIYSSMKSLYEEIQKTVEKLKEILELCKKEEEYGVLRVHATTMGGSIELYEGELYFNIKHIGEITGVKREEVEEKVKQSWKETLNWLIAFEEEQLKRMKEFLKEAEKYLVVEVIDDEDEESEEY